MEQKSVTQGPCQESGLGPSDLLWEMIHAVSNMCSVQSHGWQWQVRPMERIGASIQWCCGHSSPQWEGDTECWWQHWLGCHFEFFKFCFLKPLGFRSSVLEPNLDLSLGEVEGTGEFGSFCYGQILFLSELSLQGQELGGGEGGPWLPVGFVLSQSASWGAHPPWRRNQKKGLLETTLHTNLVAPKSRMQQYSLVYHCNDLLSKLQLHFWT